MSGHTKGPWAISKHGRLEGADGGDIGISGLGITIQHYDDREGAANARLIAAAPDMYEALSGVLHAVDIGLINIRPQDREVFGQLLTEVNAAISKAEWK